MLLWAVLAWGPLAACAEGPGSVVIHLDDELIAAGDTLRGSLSGDWQSRTFRLVWVDGLGRVACHAECRPRNSQASVTFALDGSGAFGTQHRLVVLSTPSAKDKKAPLDWQLVAKANFRTMQASQRPAYPVFTENKQLQAELADLSAGPVLPVTALAETPFLPPSSPLMVLTEIPLRSPLRPRNEKEWAQESWRFLTDRRPGVRSPDLFDAKAWDQMRADLNAAARQSRPFGPTALMLGSAVSLAPMPKPFEYAPDALTLELFRAWLRRRYEDLAHLNRQWDTSFERWDDVAPLTTDETKARRDPQYATWLELVRQGDVDKKLTKREDRFYLATNLKTLPPPGNENFSSWCDWHAFLDFSFARMVAEVRTAMHKADPEARVGFQDLLEPSPWSGQDTYELARVVDWSAAPDDGALALLLQSFRPDADRYALITGIGDTRNYLWKTWFEGASGAFVSPPDRSAKSPTPLPVDTLTELEWLTSLRRQLAPATDPVALYYSPRSVAVHWMLDSQLDGSDWPKRGSEGTQNDTPWLNYVAWVMLLRDLGIAPRFIAPAQLLSGQVNAKVLILPKVVALSEKEAQAIRDFTLRGGVVVADSQCGTFDEHGRRRPFPQGGGTVGVLDTEFGIRRENLWAHELNGAFNGDPADACIRLIDPCSPASMGPVSSELRVNEPGLRGTAAWCFGSSRGGAAAVLTRNGGTGRFIYLNLALQDYPQLRLRDETDFSFSGLDAKRYAHLFGQPTGGEALRVLVGDMLVQSIGEQVVAVRDADGRPMRSVQRFRWESGDTVLIGLRAPARGWVRPAVDQPQSPWPPETPSAEKVPMPSVIKMLYRRPLHWYDLRRGQYAGFGTSCAVNVEGHQPVLLAGLPYRMEAIKTRVRRLDRAGTFTVELSLQFGEEIPDAKPGATHHVLAVEMLGPDGKVLPHYTEKLAVEGDGWKRTIHLGLNEPVGTYRWRARDLVTGMECEAYLLKDEACYDKLFPSTEPQKKAEKK